MKNGYAFAIISVLIFSSMGLVVRFISLPGFVVYFFAALVSAAIFGAILIKEKRLKAFFKKKLWLPAAIGIFGVVNNVAYFYAYKLTTIANATFVHYFAPVLVASLAPLLLSEKTKRNIWYALILSIAGVFVLVRPAVTDLTSKNFLGLSLALVSAVGYALGMLFVRNASSKGYDTKELVFSQMALSAIILTPFVLYLRPAILMTDILPLLTLGFIHQGIAILLMFKALEMLPAQNVSIIGYLEPVGALILAGIILKEALPISTAIGGALILLSCLLAISNISFRKHSANS